LNCCYMERAIELARKGTGRTHPNPLVGAVIVKNGRIIGEGYHAKYGELHAERHALSRCTESPYGADIYVTLEPCCHHGKQPPCTDALIEAGIKRVFIGSYDPNPLVSGKSKEILQNAGIEVTYEIMKEECDRLNPFFFYYMTNNMPYVICKYAMSADGKIACKNGSSKWITGVTARARVQETRKAVSAVMVGIGTVLADDPSLLCRCEDPVHPVRVVCDTHLRMPLECELVRSADIAPVVIMTCSNNEEKAAALIGKGVKVYRISEKNGHTDISEVMRKLTEMGLTSVFVEGGAELHASVFREKLVCEVQAYIAPKIVGGDGLSPVGKLGLEDMMNAMLLSVVKTELLDSDILITYSVK
jgi:diaminohydroxyphosphoribosylaminopyrimidine deaminase/5-amino-6-(5-phosphoribosylamino)uracil reductase